MINFMIKSEKYDYQKKKRNYQKMRSYKLYY